MAYRENAFSRNKEENLQIFSKIIFFFYFVTEAKNKPILVTGLLVCTNCENIVSARKSF